MSKKLTPQEKQKFVSLLADLLENGFSLNESLNFICKTDSFSPILLSIFQTNLKKGGALYRSFSRSGFTTQQTVQIQFAGVHGNLASTLRSMAKQIQLMEKQKQNFRKIITYPGLLLLFLTGIFLAMRQILLPQLLDGDMVDPRNIGIRILRNFPILLGAVCLAILLLVLILKIFFSKKSSLNQAVFLGKCPLIRNFYRPYVSAYFALEWGKLFQEGLELRHVLFCMKKTRKKTLMRELATEMEQSMKKGRLFDFELGNYAFFTREFVTIIRQGEAKGKLGRELLLYSELTWQRFFMQMEKMMTWIQPLVFLFVAALIILIYAAMLLPIYGNMEGFM